ncbi:MAG TPA: BBP7 family outer membrane beta-barrel protein [Gemmataceae bacterium]
MRRILLGLGSFAIWFGGAVLCARAEEITWRSARPAGGVVQAGHQAEAPAPRPAATLGPPRAVLGPPRPLEEAAPAPVWTSPRPAVPAAGGDRVIGASHAPPRVARGQDPGIPAPMPKLDEGSAPLGSPRPVQPPTISESRDGEPVTPAPGLAAPPLYAGPVEGMPATVVDDCCAPLECDWLGGCAGCGICPGCGGWIDRWYGSAEYLMWWTRGDQVPALVTTSPPGSQGILGFPGTRVLLGNEELLGDQRNGGRFTLGWWYDPCHRWGLETTFFFLGEDNATYAFDSASIPVLARPFFNPNPNVTFDGVPSPGQLSEVVAIPGALDGSINVKARNNLWGIEGNVRHNLRDGCVWRFDLLSGFRFVHLADEISITENIRAVPGATDPRFAGFVGTINDTFRTSNDFYGGQLGFISELNRGRWSLIWTTKVALGWMNQTVDITGSQVFMQNGPLQVVRGGLLAIPGANIGRFERDRFAVVPEVGLNLGYQLTPHVRLFVGYNFLFLSNIVRAGDQIDTVVDAARVPTFAPPGAVPLPVVRPRVPFHETGFWAQGINFGVQMVW